MFKFRVSSIQIVYVFCLVVFFGFVFNCVPYSGLFWASWFKRPQYAPQPLTMILVREPEIRIPAFEMVTEVLTSFSSSLGQYPKMRVKIIIKFCTDFPVMMESFFRSNFVQKHRQYVRRQMTGRRVCGRSNIQVLIGKDRKFGATEFCRAFIRPEFLVRSFLVRAL